MIGHERTELAVPGGGPAVPGSDAPAREHRPVEGPENPRTEGSAGTLVRRVWNAPLLAHVLVLALVLVGVAAATSQPDSFTTDEGSYEIQLRALDQGAWTWTAGTEALDPDGTHYPVAYSTEAEDGWVPLVKHPLWPWAAAQLSKVAGPDHAYDLLGSFAVLAAAVSAWFLAGTRDRRLQRSAFWVAGLAPVAVTATFGWAHAASAAAAGLAVLGAVRLAERDRSQGTGAAVLAVALVAVGLALGILVRSEGLLFAVALAIGLPVGARRAGRGWTWSVLAGGAVLAWSVVVYKAEDLWVRSIVGTGSETLSAKTGGGVEASGFLDARFQGAIRSMLDVEGRAAAMLVFLALLGTAVAAVQVVRRQPGWLPRWQIGMLVLTVAFAFRVIWMVDLAIRGMFIAWPILLVGVAAAGSLLWRRFALETVTSLLFVGAILATQYPDGGAVQWGGRFFAPLTVPLAVLVASGIRRLLEAEDEDRLTATEPSTVALGRALVVALVVLPLVLGAWLCANIRTFMTETYTGVDARIEGVAVTPDPQLPRMMWRYDVPWLVVEQTDHGADLTELLASLRSRPDGPDEVSVVVRRYDLVQAADALDAFPGWTETGRADVNGITVINLER